QPSRRTEPATRPSKRVPAQTAPRSATSRLRRCAKGASSKPTARSVRGGRGSRTPALYFRAMADELRKAPDPGPLEAKREPPVVARLVVEIRSDGSHTIARGAAED